MIYGAFALAYAVALVLIGAAGVILEERKK